MFDDILIKHKLTYNFLVSLCILSSIFSKLNYLFDI